MNRYVVTYGTVAELVSQDSALNALQQVKTRLRQRYSGLAGLEQVKIQVRPATDRDIALFAEIGVPV